MTFRNLKSSSRGWHANLVALLALSGVILAVSGITEVTAEEQDSDRDGRHCNGQGSFSGDVLPFYAIDYVLVSHLLGVAVCNGDVESMRSFWRSYYRYYGCSADSRAASSIEWMLESEKEAYTAEARHYYGTYFRDNPNACDEVLRTCTLPPEFDPDDPAVRFNCSFLDLRVKVENAFKNELQSNTD